MYGRKPVSVITLFVFTVLIIPCAVCDSVTQLIIFRFLSALAGSAMISCAPGSVSDIVDDDNRALAFSIWSIGPFNGPGNFPFLFLGRVRTNAITII
jgi:MFS family permease